MTEHSWETTRPFLRLVLPHVKTFKLEKEGQYSVSLFFSHYNKWRKSVPWVNPLRNAFPLCFIYLTSLHLAVCPCATRMCTGTLNEGLSWKITKVSHLEGLFSLERNPGQWFVCTAFQRPPAQTWWRVTSEIRKQRERDKREWVPEHLYSE